MRRLPRLVLGLITIAVPVAWAAPASSAAACGPPSRAGWDDFNGDGAADLAVGVPGEDLGGQANAGAVNVIYGSAGGLAPAGNQLWSEARFGRAAPNQAFGAAVASGDFDRDGCGDLAVVVGGERSVRVLRGSPSGLVAAGSQLLTELGSFGGAAAAGDFDGDGFADLAVGNPGLANVTVVFGAAGGLDAASRQTFVRDNGCGVDNFGGVGEVLAAGDFDGDGRDDLAVGNPTRCGTLGGVFSFNLGAVEVRYGSPTGLDGPSQSWTEDSPGVADAAEAEDRFGAELAAADLGRTRHDDLVVAAPFEDLRPTARDAGAVHVLYGSAAKLTATGSRLFTQNTPGIPDASDPDDFFGRSLAVGDYGRSAQSDLAIGVPDEDRPPAVPDAGLVTVVYGSPSGASPTGAQFWTQNRSGIPDQIESGDRFGSALGQG